MNRNQIWWGAGCIALALLMFNLGLLYNVHWSVAARVRLPAPLAAFLWLSFPFSVIPATLGLTGVLLVSLGVTAQPQHAEGSAQEKRILEVDVPWGLVGLAASALGSTMLFVGLPFALALCFYLIGSESDPMGPLLFSGYLTILAFFCSSFVFCLVALWRWRQSERRQRRAAEGEWTVINLS